MTCRCGPAFCSKHRQPENHDCTFDFQAFQQSKLARENPQVTRSTGNIKSEREWLAQYAKLHPNSRLEERRLQQFHSLGALVLVAFTLRGVLQTILNSRLLHLPQQIVIGYSCGLCICWYGPRLCGFRSSSCRCCIFSWDLLSVHALWCLAAEWESCKENLIYALTAGKTNCLTGPLYDGPRTLEHILRTAATRCMEVVQGAKCS